MWCSASMWGTQRGRATPSWVTSTTPPYQRAPARLHLPPQCSMSRTKDGMVRQNIFFKIFFNLQFHEIPSDRVGPHVNPPPLSHQEFLSFSAVVKLWMSGRQRCVCSSPTCQETSLANAARGTSWWCGYSRTKPFTWRWWPRGPGFTSAQRRLSWTSPTGADTRCFRLTH